MCTGSAEIVNVDSEYDSANKEDINNTLTEIDHNINNITNGNNSDESTSLSSKILALSLSSDDAVKAINDGSAVEENSNHDDEKKKRTSFTTSSNDNRYDRDSSEPLLKRSVSFSCVEIRKYPIILGDNPSCQRGAPISIDWNYFEKNDHLIDDYELGRNGNRRSKSEFKVGPQERRKILKEESGVTDERIRYAILAVNQMQQRRIESMHCKQLKWEDKKDKMVKKLRSILKKTASKTGKNGSFNNDDITINSGGRRQPASHFQRPNKSRAYRRFSQDNIFRRSI